MKHSEKRIFVCAFYLGGEHHATLHISDRPDMFAEFPVD